ncbi:hypothetical protein KCU73_g12501, partial [Aureobasidium melanogenum]
MSEISGLREQILANYDHLRFATPASRADIIVETVRDGGYNAVITDKVSRKRVIDCHENLDCHENHNSVTQALEELLRHTCVMLSIQRDDPARWRRLTSGAQGVAEEDKQESELESEDEELPELVDMPDERPVVPGSGQATSKRPASHDDSNGMYRGFEPRPGRSGSKRPRTEMLPPIGDATFAAWSCSSLPLGTNDTVKKMLYELITRPRHLSLLGVLLSDITADTGIENRTLLAAAEDLEKIGRAWSTNIERSAWMPRNAPDAGTSSIVPRFSSGNRGSYRQSGASSSQPTGQAARIQR